MRCALEADALVDGEVDKGDSTEGERQHHQHAHDLEENLLQVAQGGRLVEHGGRLAEEGELARVRDSALCLPAGDGGAHEAEVLGVLGHGEGLSRHARLVHLDLAFVDLNGGGGRREAGYGQVWRIADDLTWLVDDDKKKQEVENGGKPLS